MPISLSMFAAHIFCSFSLCDLAVQVQSRLISIKKEIENTPTDGKKVSPNTASNDSWCCFLHMSHTA